MLLDYMRVIVNLGLLTTEAMSRTIEYLKAYNSRTCQVVLGAGAMRSAGLKNITAKHLGTKMCRCVAIDCVFHHYLGSHIFLSCMVTVGDPLQQLLRRSRFQR